VVDCRIGFITEGNACWRLNDATYKVGPGDVIVVLPGSNRSAQAHGAFRHAAVTLRLVRGDNDLGMQSVQEMPGWLILPGRIHVGLESIEELITLLRLANAEAELRRSGYKEMVDALVRQFLVRLYRLAQERQLGRCERLQPDGPDGIALQSAALHRAVEYIHLHLDDAIHVSKIAEVCGYSEPHLRRLFHEHVGMTPSEYIAAARIRRAQQLLRTGLFTISQVAEAVGYSDPFHFSRKFKRIVGLSPRAFARK